MLACVPQLRAELPELLGIPRSAGDEIFRHNPYKIDNRSLYYAPSIGTDARFADVILAQTKNFNDVK